MPTYRKSHGAAVMSVRRDCLRGLVSLPVVGGSAGLIGQPTKVKVL